MLRVVVGLGVPSRGVVRLNGHNVTLVFAGDPGASGVSTSSPGGKAIFAPMSVRENLEMAGFIYRKDRTDRRERFDRALSMFPELGTRLDDTAGSHVGRSAADARAGDGADARPGDPVDRRAVARARADHGGVAARSGRPAQARRSDDDHRRAVPQRGARPSPTARCSWRRVASGSRVPRRICSSATTSSAPCSSAASRRDGHRWRSRITRQVVYGGFVNGLSIGLLALGRRADLPLEPGDQLRRRRAGCVLRRACWPCWSCSTTGTSGPPRWWPSWPADVFAAAIEMTVITRLFRAPRVIVLVATIGIARSGSGRADVATQAGRRQPRPRIRPRRLRHLARSSVSRCTARSSRS